jgi:hypothetical protein
MYAAGVSSAYDDDVLLCAWCVWDDGCVWNSRHGKNLADEEKPDGMFIFIFTDLVL